MKTPINYYGGKQKLVPVLRSLFPPHKKYVEPFVGGGAAFWDKEPSTHETINDIDYRVINFYEVVQTRFDELNERVQLTLNSEHQHREAARILRAPLLDPVAYAWAFWVSSCMSFGSKLLGGWAFGCNSADIGSEAKTLANRKLAFQKHLAERLRNVDIFCRDAIEVIQLSDGPDTFFYFDSPYPESDCGHYAGREEVYYRLLDLLPTLQAKWLMSSYPSEQLTELRCTYGWESHDQDMHLSMSRKHKVLKRKQECLTMNYRVAEQPIGLFAAEHLALP